MRIIKDREVVEDRGCHAPADGEDGPATLPHGDIIVPLDTWKARRDELVKRNTRLGVKLEPDDEPADIAGDLEHFAVIALNFPTFKDGRCYSTARLLRERYGYAGELRAVGDVLRDQIFYMARCGIDAFEVRADRDLGDALRAFDDFSVTYQGAADEPRPLFRR